MTAKIEDWKVVKLTFFDTYFNEEEEEEEEACYLVRNKYVPQFNFTNVIKTKTLLPEKEECIHKQDPHTHINRDGERWRGENLPLAVAATFLHFH